MADTSSQCLRAASVVAQKWSSWISDESTYTHRANHVQPFFYQCDMSDRSIFSLTRTPSANM